MDTPTMQRVRSSAAALDRHAFEIADRFLDAFFARCPHLRTDGRFSGAPTVQRRTVALTWAWLARNLGQLESLTPGLEALGFRLTRLGLSEADRRVARESLIDALRDVARAGWTMELEQDWNAAFDACERFACPAAPVPLGTERPLAAAA